MKKAILLFFSLVVTAHLNGALAVGAIVTGLLWRASADFHRSAWERKLGSKMLQDIENSTGVVKNWEHTELYLEPSFLRMSPDYCLSFESRRALWSRVRRHQQVYGLLSTKLGSEIPISDGPVREILSTLRPGDITAMNVWNPENKNREGKDGALWELLIAHGRVDAVRYLCEKGIEIRFEDPERRVENAPVSAHEIAMDHLGKPESEEIRKLLNAVN